MTDRGTGRVRARAGEGDRLREQILAAAEQLLVEAGGEQTLTLRSVAGAVGVTTPSLYRHFPDRASLVSAVCLRVWSELGERLERSAEAQDDPFQALRARAHAYVRFGLDHPVQYRLLLLRPPTSARSTAEEQAAHACRAEMVRAVRACVEAGVLRGDPSELSLTLWACVHGCVCMLITRPPFPEPPDVEAFIDATVRAAGLGHALAGRLPADAPVRAPVLSARLDRLADDLRRGRG